MNGWWSVLATAGRYALIGGAIGVLMELLVPTVAPALGLLGLVPVILLYLSSLPLWLVTHSASLPVWVVPLNLALWGFAVGAILGAWSADRRARESAPNNAGAPP